MSGAQLEAQGAEVTSPLGSTLVWREASLLLTRTRTRTLLTLLLTLTQAPNPDRSRNPNPNPNRSPNPNPDPGPDPEPSPEQVSLLLGDAPLLEIGEVPVPRGHHISPTSPLYLPYISPISAAPSPRGARAITRTLTLYRTRTLTRTRTRTRTLTLTLSPTLPCEVHVNVPALCALLLPIALEFGGWA